MLLIELGTLLIVVGTYVAIHLCLANYTVTTSWNRPRNCRLPRSLTALTPDAAISHSSRSSAPGHRC